MLYCSLWIASRIKDGSRDDFCRLLEREWSRSGRPGTHRMRDAFSGDSQWTTPSIFTGRTSTRQAWLLLLRYGGVGPQITVAPHTHETTSQHSSRDAYSKLHNRNTQCEQQSSGASGSS